MSKVALITGVAGGIGRATSMIFAEAGWHVIGVDQFQSHGLSGVARFIHADISDANVPERITEDIMANERRLDAVVNNAALQICKPMVETTPEEWDSMMACNVRAAFLLVRAAYPLLKRTSGAVVNVSSVHAIATSQGIAGYAASKGALLALTRAMALELAVDGIRVNAVLPGAVDTPMLHEGLSRGHVEGRSIKDLLDTLAGKHALGRIGQPEEIGSAILFLADSDRSSFMTGQSLTVDGGATARLSTE